MKTKESKTTACLYIALLVITIVFFVSCGKDAISTALLRDAESLMEEKPDSAYALLQQADSIATFNRAQRAEWNLLMTQAMDKAKIPSPSDSLIQEAVNYYENKKNPQREMLASYYMGRFLRNKGDIPHAQQYYLKAHENAILANDSFYLARINSNLGMLYLYQELPEMAIPYLMEADAYISTQKDSADIRLTKRDLARAYDFQQKKDSAIIYYKEALSYSLPRQRIGLLNEIVHVYINMQELDKAAMYIKEIERIAESSRPAQTHLILGEYYKEIGRPDSSIYYLKKCLNTKNLRTQAAAIKYLYQIAREEKDWDNYATYQKESELLRDSISQITRTERMMHLQAAYNYERKENELFQIRLAHIKQQKLSIVWGAIAIILALCTVFFYYRTRQHKREMKEKQLRWEQMQKNQKENIQSLIEENKISIKHLQEHLAKKEKEVRQLRFQKDNGVTTKKEDDHPLPTDKEVYDKELVTSKLYKKMSDPGSVKITKREMDEFTQLIDQYYPTFYSSLLQLYPSPKEDERLICYFSRVNISPKSIAIILNQSLSSISNKRAKLAAKIFGQESKASIFEKKIKNIF